MPKKRESKWNIEELTDAEIHEAIRYLESAPKRSRGQGDATFVICVSLLILVLGCIGFIWLYH